MVGGSAAPGSSVAISCAPCCRRATTRRRCSLQLPQLAGATTLRPSRGPPTQRKLQRLAWRGRPKTLQSGAARAAGVAAGPLPHMRWLCGRRCGSALHRFSRRRPSAAASHEQAVVAQHARHLPVQRLEQIQLKVGQGLQFGSKRLEGWLHELALAGSAMRGALERDPVRGEEGGRAGGRRRAWHCCSSSAAGVDRRCCLRCLAIDWRGWSRPTHCCQLTLLPHSASKRLNWAHAP